MFEDAMMESGGRIRTRSRYYTGVGVVLNGAVLAGLILVPLLYPEALPKNALTTMLVAPPPPSPPPPPAAPVRLVRAVQQMPDMEVPTRIPKQIDTRPETAPPGPAAPSMGDSGPGLPGGLFNSNGSGQPVVVKPPAPKKVAVSQGVMAGNILSKPEPLYPPIARAARVQGTVVLSAVISKTGTIENLTVVSGPALLAAAAVDAVRQWRYRPYLLNGAPVEVQTQVNVTFSLGN